MRTSHNRHRRKRLRTASVLLLVAGVFFVTLVQRHLSGPSRISSSGKASFKSANSSSAFTSPAGLSAGDKTRLNEWTANLPLAFEPNKGQAGPQVKFLASGRASQLLLTSNEAILRLRNGEFTLKFEGANPSASLNGMEQLPGYRNYFHG